MTPEAQIIAIAEACGWELVRFPQPQRNVIRAEAFLRTIGKWTTNPNEL